MRFLWAGIGPGHHTGYGIMTREFTGRMPSYAVDHQEDAALRVRPVAVLVALAEESSVGRCAGCPGHDRLQFRRTNATTKTRNATTNGVCHW